MKTISQSHVSYIPAGPAKRLCSGYRFRLAQKEGRLGEYYLREIKEIPDQGCYENLSKAVASYGIIPEDIPSPFNLSQHMKIDGVTYEP